MVGHDRRRGAARVERETTCCFTGHRPDKLPWGTNEEDPRCVQLKQRLAQAVEREEAALAGEGRVLVRPSGTEALIRVMVEAKTTQIAQAVADRLADFIKSQKK